MAWSFERTFKQRQGFAFTFDCRIRENDVELERRDLTVTYDPQTGVAAAGQALYQQVVAIIKVELVARLPQVQTPTVVPINPADLA